jgi:hypothetical protein
MVSSFVFYETFPIPSQDGENGVSHRVEEKEEQQQQHHHR